MQSGDIYEYKGKQYKVLHSKVVNVSLPKELRLNECNIQICYEALYEDDTLKECVFVRNKIDFINKFKKICQEQLYLK